MLAKEHLSAPTQYFVPRLARSSVDFRISPDWPAYIDIPSLLSAVRVRLAFPCCPIKFSAITALYHFVQRNALRISRLGGDKPAEEPSRMLGRETSIAGVRNVVASNPDLAALISPGYCSKWCPRLVCFHMPRMDF